MTRTEYNDLGAPKERVHSVYAFSDAAPTTQRFRGMSINAFSAGAPGGGPNYVYNPYETWSAWYHIEADTTVVYDDGGGSSFSTVRTYEYGNPEHLQLTEVRETNSDGMERVTRMRYPADYQIPGGSLDQETEALAEMKEDAHIHSAVIERWVSEVSGSIERVIEGELTTFRLFGERVLPYRRFVLDRTEPQP
jgi:hypothetical protein